MVEKKKVDVVRIELVKEREVSFEDYDIEKLRVSKPEYAVKLVSTLFENSDREKVYVCALDTNKKPINISLVSMGGMNQCVIHIPEIFKAAILANCPNIIVFHNHVSGNIKPSNEDKVITSRLEEAGEILQIKLQDHIIVGKAGQFFSFKREGLIYGKEKVA